MDRQQLPIPTSFAMMTNDQKAAALQQAGKARTKGKISKIVRKLAQEQMI